MSSKPETNFRKRVQKFFKPFEIRGDVDTYWSQELSKVGIPDAFQCYFGAFLALEIKSEDGHLSKLQIYNLRKAARSGGIAIALWPSGWECFKRDYDSFGRAFLLGCKKHVMIYKDNEVNVMEG